MPIITPQPTFAIVIVGRLAWGSNCAEFTHKSNRADWNPQNLPANDGNHGQALTDVYQKNSIISEE